MQNVKYSSQKCRHISDLSNVGCVNLTIQKTNTREVLLNTLHQSMKSIFGESGAFVFYRHLEEFYLLNREDIFDKPQVFAKVLTQIFGKTGAEIVEALLAKDMCTKLGIIDRDDEINSLVDCFDKLKTNFSGVCKAKHIGD